MFDVLVLAIVRSIEKNKSSLHVKKRALLIGKNRKRINNNHRDKKEINISAKEISFAVERKKGYKTAIEIRKK